MKRKLLLTLTVLSCFASVVTAQISKGSRFLGGSISYYNNEQSNYASKNKQFYIGPAFGIAVKDNLIKGADLIFNQTKYTSEDMTSSRYDKNVTYGAGYFIRKYLPVLNRFYIFAQGRLGVNRITQETRYISSNPLNNNWTDSKGWSVGLSLYPGISYAVNKSLHLEAGFNNLFNIQYSIVKGTATNFSSGTSTPRKIKTTQFAASSNLNNLSSFSVGFRLLMAK